MPPLPSLKPTDKEINGRRVWALVADFVVDREGFKPVTVPKDFESDGASVPLCLAWFISSVGKGFLEAGIIHDFLYRHGPFSRAQADLTFRELLREWKVPAYKAWLAYIALRLFGRRNYKPMPWVAAMLAVLFLAAPAHAERRLITFTDPSYCPHCVRLERTFARPAIQREIQRLQLTQKTVNSSNCTPELLAKWQVRTIPATFLVDVDDENGKAVLLDRRDGAMSEAELIRFMRGPE